MSGVEEVIPMFERVLPFVSASTLIAVAREPWQRAGSAALRRQVFCAEQGVFQGDDGDRHDADALTIVALSLLAGIHDRVVGTVRIYPQRERVWYGGRLAVAREYRRERNVGERLTRAAVATARALGATRFLATVQAANVAFFARQHFAPGAALTLHGRPHVRMEADLMEFAHADAVLLAGAA